MTGVTVHVCAHGETGGTQQYGRVATVPKRR